MDLITCTSNDELKNLTPEVGQIVMINNNDEPKKIMMWTGTEWQNIKMDANSEVTLTAYEINQQLIHQLPPLDKDTLMEKNNLILDFCNNTNNEYYMLLCRDFNYYTLCNRVENQSISELITIQDLVIECASALGEIKAIEEVEGAIEIWIDNEQGTYAMYFFPYDRGVEICQ